MIAPVRAGPRVVGTVDLESDPTGAFTDADLARRLAATLAPLWASTQDR